MTPCRRASRRSCRPCRSPCRGRAGSACRAGGRGSSPTTRPGRRTSSRRASAGSSRGRSATNRVPSYVPLALLSILGMTECRFERRDCPLARLARLLGRERGLDLGLAPTGGGLRDVRDRHGTDVDPGRGRLGRRGGLLLCRFRLRLCLLGLRLRRRSLRLSADRLDLDARKAAAMAVVPLVAGALLVFPDADLLAELVADDARGDGRRRREIGCAVAANKQDARLEGLALLHLEAVDNEPLALLDAVLLTAETDDRVAAHEKCRCVENAGCEPASGAV